MLPAPLPPGAIISISDGRTSACATRSRLAGGSGEKEAAEAVTPPPAFCSHPPPPPPPALFLRDICIERGIFVSGACASSCCWFPIWKHDCFPAVVILGKMWLGFGDMHRCGHLPEHPCLPQPHPTTQRFTVLPSKSSSKAAQGHRWEVSACFWAHVPRYPCLSFPGRGCTGACKLQRAAVRINYHP